MKNFFSKLFGSRTPAGAGNSGRAGLKAGRTPDENPATIEDGSDNALRRQLVHVLLRDVLRRHGISSSLFECQMLVVSSRSRGPGMYVRLVVRQWDERLVRYAFAFQKALMADILRFEPQAAEWLHGVSWQFEFDESCPYAELPDKAFWQGLGGPPSGATPLSPASSPAQPAQPVQTATELATAARQANAARRAALVMPDQPDETLPAHRSNAPTDLMPLSTKQSEADVKKSEEAEDLERLFAIRDRELGHAAGDDIAQVGYEKTRPSPL